ncbi:MFS transporter [Humidisolicoccus flavus]|uniref:MFS transporter n=1 Tax=Humidisolicoccus flavus TaxID=3111414 RepID=UPI003249C63C
MTAASAVVPPRTAVPRRAWRMLVLVIAAEISGTVLVTTPAFLIPYLHGERGLSLAEAGTLAGAPTLGMVCTLVLWGALADRFGERRVIVTGLSLAAIAAVIATQSSGFVLLGVLLFLGGASTASVNAASGRTITGWFPRERRGLVMGIRQMSQPLGVTVSALAIPALAAAAAAGGIVPALVLPAAMTATMALACGFALVNPPRPARMQSATHATAPKLSGSPNWQPAQNPQPEQNNQNKQNNPYCRSAFLPRTHLVSALLVIPQFTLSTFGIVWMTTQLSLDAALAGLIIGGSQAIGAVGRIVVGQLSDRLGSRVRVIRAVAVAGVVALPVLAFASYFEWTIAAVIMFAVATTISVADNGLAFTNVAEAAGSQWQGKALGLQNTGQFLTAAGVGPALGALITVIGYPLAFATVAVAPALAFPLIPKADEHRD